MAMYTRLPSLSKEWLILRRTETRWNKNASWVKVDEKVYPTNDPTTGWTDKSKRTGLLAVKLGMFTDMDDWGNLHPLTVLQVKDCQVMAVMTEEKNGYSGIQLGAGEQRIKRLGKSVLGQFAKADILPKRRIEEFRITPEAAIPVGTTLSARHFVPGQVVDVCGITKGKGFQGAMKRWGFGGLPATHGVSLTHRSLGATGARQDPGKVWKGKKMHGHMGNQRVTTKNLKVYQIDLVTNTIAVVGNVPGSTNEWVRVTDGLSYKWEVPPPFPTYTVTGQEPQVQRMKFTRPRALIEDADEENRTWAETLGSKFPLRISPQLLKRWEQARVEYRSDLEHGRLKNVLQEKFPEALPVEEDIQEWRKRLEEDQAAAILDRQKKQMKQPIYRRNAENEKKQKLEKAAKKQAQQAEQ